MTEAEWLASEDPRPMAEVALKSARASDRTCRLFVAAFWGWQARQLPAGQQGGLQRRVNVVAQWAELGSPPKETVASAPPSFFYCSDPPRALAKTVQAPDEDWKRTRQKAIRMQSLFLRDIFGNPFRPMRANPAWLTSDVVALSRGIYEEKAFDRMPILADALQDAGCHDDILSHCRDTTAIHVRGCWVLDLVLGKG